MAGAVDFFKIYGIITTVKESLGEYRARRERKIKWKIKWMI